MRQIAIQAVVALALCAVSCEDRPGDRAQLDLGVGRATAGDVRFVVEGGLAAVRHAAPRELSLWASAPTFTLVADSKASASQTWRITIHNAVPDAVLSGTTVDVLEAEVATVLRFDVALPPGTTTLTLATADVSSRAPFRFALVSDVQEGIDEVGDVFAAIDAQPDLRFVLGAGDLAEVGTREELERFQDELRGLSLPYYTTLGNHDVGAPWQELFGRGSFHFVFRGVHFTLLDSAAATIDTLAFDWLEGWLAEGRDAVHVFATHVPPLDPVGTRNGAFGDRHEAGRLLGKLANGGVDLTLYGHVHSFYRFENAGIPAFISGGGGADDEKLDGYGRHFMVIEVGADAGVVATDAVFVD